MNHQIDSIRNYVSTTLGMNGAHGLDHTLRVTDLCTQIGRREGADMEILIAAALLHDIARPVEEELGIPHEEEGSRIAEGLLRSLGYPESVISGVIHAILTHRYRTSRIPETLEAKILSDADKLDAMGAVGIARAFMTAGERNGDMQDALDHIRDKLLNLKGLMYTAGGQELASERHRFLEGFRDTLCRELNSQI